MIPFDIIERASAVGEAELVFGRVYNGFIIGVAGADPEPYREAFADKPFVSVVPVVYLFDTRITSVYLRLDTGEFMRVFPDASVLFSSFESGYLFYARVLPQTFLEGVQSLPREIQQKFFSKIISKQGELILVGDDVISVDTDTVEHKSFKLEGLVDADEYLLRDGRRLRRIWYSDGEYFACYL